MCRVILIISLLSFSCCKSSLKKSQIVDSKWKYDKGYHIGDIVQFETKTYILTQNMEVYKNGVKVAKIIKANKQEMILQSSDIDKSTGRYVFFGIAGRP